MHRPRPAHPTKNLAKGQICFEDGVRHSSRHGLRPTRLEPKNDLETLQIQRLSMPHPLCRRLQRTKASYRRTHTNVDNHACRRASLLLCADAHDGLQRSRILRLSRIRLCQPDRRPENPQGRPSMRTLKRSARLSSRSCPAARRHWNILNIKHSTLMTPLRRSAADCIVQRLMVSCWIGRKGCASDRDWARPGADGFFRAAAGPVGRGGMAC